MLAFEFDNRWLRELPGDPDTGPQRRQVAAAWSHAPCTPVPAPRTLAVSAAVAALLDIEPADLGDPGFAHVFAGNRLLPGMQPIASNYGGHQFGHWAGQLGDGRAISLGETVNARGERWELQLKGAGPTPYSRSADGRAVLRSSLREFVCSEAMAALGVPTTRALSLVATGDSVLRDMFYDGRAAAEPGAVVCRVAPSFVRFGHFELPAARGDPVLLRQLVEFTLRRDFPHLQGAQAWADGFHEICLRTADTLAHWMRVGFVHGVMNTDNMSILGLTLDYGPFGWIEDYDPDWTPNTTDAGQRRYRFGAQPQVAQWNLAALASALAIGYADHDALRAGLAAYARRFEQEHARLTALKLGLHGHRDDDAELAAALFRWLAAAGVDMSLFFRQLGELDPQLAQAADFAATAYDDARFDRQRGELQDWLARRAARLDDDPRPAALRRQSMHAVNPLYVPRNWLCQQAIDAALQDDLVELHQLMRVLSEPYRQQAGAERFAQRRPDWARDRAGCSMLSCSS